MPQIVVDIAKTSHPLMVTVHGHHFRHGDVVRWEGSTTKGAHVFFWTKKDIPGEERVPVSHEKSPNGQNTIEALISRLSILKKAATIMRRS